MKTHPPAGSREEDLEEALRGLCSLVTKLQERAAGYLPEGEPDAFINDVLELLDGPEQRRVQRAARALLNETHVQIPLRRATPSHGRLAVTQ
jgi:hypothetical protein